MSGQERAQDEAAATPAAKEAEAPDEAAEAVAKAAAEETPAAAKAEDPIAALEAEKASLKDHLLRSLAETENLRRRMQRDREDMAKYAAAPLAKDLLSVRDNLRRAIDSVPQAAVGADPHLKSLLEGVELTERGLLEAFERHSIEAIEPLGEKLDPHFHEAMFEVEDPNQAPGTIVQVFEVGYRLHDRLLRPARVGVAKASAATKAGPAVPDAENAGQDAEAGKSTDSPGGEKPGGRVDTAV